MGYGLNQNRDAVVTIVTTTDVTVYYDYGNEPVIYNFIQTNTGNGFLIDQNHVITASHLVIFNEIIYPGFQIKRTEPSNSQIVKVNRIYVHVFNVNGMGESFIYDATLLGLDGAGDIAILKIEKTEHAPCICQQPTLTFFNSQLISPGDKIYLLGNPNMLDYQSVVIGTVRNNAYNDMLGQVVTESMLIDCNIVEGISGSPIVSSNGVVGMATWYSDSSFGGGPSQKIMESVLSALFEAIGGSPGQHTLYQEDPLGGFWIYYKGFMGITWNIVTELNYFFKADTNEKLDPPTKDRKIVGIAITGFCNPDEVGVTSPFAEFMEIGDIITHINDRPLGNLKGQISPTSITWFKSPGDEITIKYRKMSESFNFSHCKSVALASFPLSLDRAFFNLASSEIKRRYYADGKNYTSDEFLLHISEKIGFDLTEIAPKYFA